MPYAFGATSTARLLTVHPLLQKVMLLAISRSPQDFMIVEGARSKEQMWANWGKGRSAAECEAAGVPTFHARPKEPKVTWLRDPLKSNHRVMDDGFGRAVDTGAIVNGKYDGSNEEAYDLIAVQVLKAARELKAHVRWGADWDEDGKAHEKGETDMAHFELIL